MRSAADGLRQPTMRQVLHLPVRARVELAPSVGGDDLELFVRTSGLNPATALERLRAAHRHGRTPSRAAGDDDEPL